MARSRKDPEPYVNAEERRKRLRKKLLVMKMLFFDSLISKGKMAKFLLKSVRLSNLEFAEEIDDLNKRKKNLRGIPEP